MQWRNEAIGKGLTKSSFEALVRGALHGTSNQNKIKRAEVHARVGAFLPQHALARLIPYIDAALRRLAKTAVRHWPKTDEFNLSYEESERLKDEAAAITNFKDVFEYDVLDIASIDDNAPVDNKPVIVETVHRIVERYFMQRGEEFAASLARDTEPPMHEADLRSIIVSVSPTGRLVPGRENVDFLFHVVSTLMTSASDAAREYLRLLSDSYTLFAFLEEMPDVQKATKKLFTQGEIWLDTSILLPIFAEQAFPETLRPFTAMFVQAKAARSRLLVTPGIVEEIERHLNLCVKYTRVDRWDGRVPYVYSQYSLAGRARSGFPSWVERFRGESQPLQDIAEYLSESFGIEVQRPTVSEGFDQSVASAIREYWRGVHDKRRPLDGMNAFRLAEHDAENCISVLTERQAQAGRSPLGYSSCWLTLDSAARDMVRKLGGIIKHSPVISVDFLLKYLAFGPTRDLVPHSSRFGYAFAAPILENLPQDLLEVAKKVRSENNNLPERIIQRRIRDALDGSYPH